MSSKIIYLMLRQAMPLKRGPTAIGLHIVGPIVHVLNHGHDFNTQNASVHSIVQFINKGHMVTHEGVKVVATTPHTFSTQIMLTFSATETSDGGALVANAAKWLEKKHKRYQGRFRCDKLINLDLCLRHKFNIEALRVASKEFMITHSEMSVQLDDSGHSAWLTMMPASS
jgi:hypothetical protein